MRDLTGDDSVESKVFEFARMGKYMKKSTVTEVSPQQAIACGVRTRAKTLALQQRLSPSAAPALEASSLSYLQLRSRRLQKPPPPLPKSTPKQPQSPNAWKCSPRPSFRLAVGPAEWGSAGFMEDLENDVENGGGSEAGDCDDLWVEASCGENALECQGTGRRTRETTPCSLIRNPDAIRTPGSTTRRMSPQSTNQRARNDLLGEIPTMHEMEEFFAYAEEQQQRLFRDKYNFDIASDLPIPGRFEWVRAI